MEIFKRTYYAEEFADIERDVSEAIEAVESVEDMDTSVTVTIEYKKRLTAS